MNKKLDLEQKIDTVIETITEQIDKLKTKLADAEQK